MSANEFERSPALATMTDKQIGCVCERPKVACLTGRIMEVTQLLRPQYSDDKQNTGEQEWHANLAEGRRRIFAFVKELGSQYELSSKEKRAMVRCPIRAAGDPISKTLSSSYYSYNRASRVCGVLARKRRKKGLWLPRKEIAGDMNRFLGALRKWMASVFRETAEARPATTQ